MNRTRLIVGLLLPGGGSLLRGQWGQALLGLGTVALLAGLAAVALVAANRSEAIDGASLTDALLALTWPLRVPPTVPVTAAMALAVHILCAWGAAREQA